VPPVKAFGDRQKKTHYYTPWVRKLQCDGTEGLVHLARWYSAPTKEKFEQLSEFPKPLWNREFKVMTFNVLAEIWGGDPRSFGKELCHVCQGAGIQGNGLKGTCFTCGGRGTADNEGLSKKVRDDVLVKTIGSDQFNPDILLLQEAQQDTVDNICKKLGYVEIHFPSHGKAFWRDWINDDVAPWQPNGQAILMKPEIARVVNYRDTVTVAIEDGMIQDDWDENHDLAFNVPIVVLTINGKNVAIVNVHLEYGCRLTSPTSIKAHPGKLRELQYEKLKAHLDMLRDDGKVDEVVMAGDFNNVSEFGNGAGSLLKKIEEDSGYVDHANANYHHKSFTHLDTCANAMKTSLRIDHILSSGGLESTSFYVPDEHTNSWWGWPLFKGVVSTNPLRGWFSGLDKGGVDIHKIITKWGSDHLPMTATLRISDGSVPLQVPSLCSISKNICGS